MQPPDAELAEDIIKIEVSRSCLGDGGVRTVRAADCTADAEASLGEVDAVSADAADAVGLLPVDQRGVNAALLDEILHQHTDLVVSESGDDGGVQAEALVQAADDVVLAAAFPCTEASCGADPALARIQAEHNLAQGNGVKLAVFSVSEIQFHEFFLL